MKGEVRKVVLAYSGGLDTSVILRWLKDAYGCEVVTFTADIGQGEELAEARRKAEMMGVQEIFVEDLREEFVRDFVFPMFRANALYEGTYLLGTSIARPLIAKRQIEIAERVGADAVAHGATGKGNDQVRFELTYYALKPDVRVIAPWREWDLTSRSRLIEYAERHQIPIPRDKRGEPPYSMDANLLHVSYEGKALEDPWCEPDEAMFLRTLSPEAAPDRATTLEIEFERGDAVAIGGEPLSPATLLGRLNEIAGANGVGRADIVENRFVGMKSRGVYETPGGTVLLHARRAVESLTLDRGAAHLKDELMPRYAELVYNGFWFTPEREALQAAIDRTQERVTGTARVKLYKGNVIVTGRRSPESLYVKDIATFEEDSVYDQRDAEGFIKLNALRLRVARMRRAGFREGDRLRIIEACGADLEDVLFVERLAFGGDNEARLVRDLLRDPSAQPVVSLLARQDERPVGHVLFTSARLEGPSRDIPISILAPLAVVPGAQRQGIGARLIEDGARRVAERGVELVFVLGHPGYYPRHGFQPASPLGLIAPYPISPEDAWMVRALRPGLLGEARGSVVCAEAMNRPEYWRE